METNFNINGYTFSDQTIKLLDKEIQEINNREKKNWMNKVNPADESEKENLTIFEIQRIKNDQIEINKINLLYQEMHFQLGNGQTLNQNEVIDFFKIFLNFKHHEGIVDRVNDVFDNNCFPVLQKIIEDNVCQKEKFTSEITKFLQKKSYGNFLGSLENNLQNFDVDCYEIIKELTKNNPY